MTEATQAVSSELLDLLAAHPVLGLLSPEDRLQLARRFEPRDIPAETIVLRQGQRGTDYYLIADGEVEIYAEEGRREVPLGTAGPGEDFGEMALLEPGGVRAASVRAVRALRCYALPEQSFRRLVAAQAPIAQRFAELAERHAKVRFLKVATAFSDLHWHEARTLAGKLGVVDLEPGTEFVTQGQAGKACYLLQSGRAQVVLASAQGTERVLAELGPGALVGEVSLLTDSPCNASVRTTERSRLLVLEREDFLDLVSRSRALNDAMLDLVELKARPMRQPGVTAHERRTAEGDTIVILKNAARRSYYRLSPRGWFLWQRMDGQATLKDLTLAYVTEFGEFAPHRIGGLIAGLARGGFLTGSAFARRRLAPGAEGRAGARVLARLRALLEWRVAVGNVDALFGTLYRLGGKWCFTRAAAALWLLVVGVGSVAAVTSLDAAAHSFFTWSPALLLGLIPAALLTAVLHECGHGLATKHVGREVAAGGFGWYWFGPMAFVDTTDTWLASPSQRVLVGLAGIAVNLFIAGAASVFAWLSAGLPAVLAWQIAALNYLAVLINLNPLLEYDGYHVLVDVTGRPGLRRRAFRRLAQVLTGGGGSSRAQPAGRLERLYALGSALYVVAMIVLTLTAFRLLLAERLHALLGTAAAQWLAWALALTVALLASAGLWQDFRVARRTSGAGAGSGGGD